MTTQPVHLKPNKLPYPIRLWNSFGGLLEEFNLGINLREESLIIEAKKAEGLNDFGDGSFREPLSILLNAIENEANLHSFGRYVTRNRLVGLLRNRLRAEHYFKKHPKILETVLTPPIVIAGLQRTGTTFLHRLISADPQFRSLKSWEALNPAPPLNWKRNGKDARISEGQWAEKGLRYLNPSFFAIHPVEFDAPEEEILLLDISFLSTVAEATLHVPSYANWLEQQDHIPAYQYMKKLLQLLTWQNPGKRWVLKTPHHLEHLDLLREIFPECIIVQTHRDPSITIPSLCSMIWHGRHIFSDQVDPYQIGKQWLRKVKIMLTNSTAYRQSVNNSGFVDVSYENLMDSTAQQLKLIYHKAGIEFSKEIESIALQEISNQKTKRYGSHNYRAEDFGLSEEIIEVSLLKVNHLS